MDLELDDDQHALVDSVRSVLASEWPTRALRRLVESGEGQDDLWRSIVALDWPAVTIPAVVGGMGLGPIEAMLVHERCGAVMVPGPLFATAGLFARAISILGGPEQVSDLLAPIAAGPSNGTGTGTGTVALTELVRSLGGVAVDRDALGADARRVDGGWRVEGRARSVIDGDRADRVVVPARLREGGVGMFVLESSVISAAPVEVADRSRVVADLTFAADVDEMARLAGRDGPEGGPDGLVRLVDEAVTMLAAELVGSCRTILDAVLEHVREREQFGVKIGSFQALKHRLADAHLELEAARASVRYASVALAEGTVDASVAASSAKALASDAASRLAHEGIQMLGGLGFTWEHDMHLFVKRAMSSAALFGTAEDHRQRTAALLGLVPA